MSRARRAETGEPADDAEVPTRSGQQSQGQAEETKPGDAEAKHVVGTSSPGGRRGGKEIKQVIDAGKSCMDAVEQSGKGASTGEAYMQG